MNTHLPYRIFHKEHPSLPEGLYHGQPVPPYQKVLEVKLNRDEEPSFLPVFYCFGKKLWKPFFEATENHSLKLLRYGTLEEAQSMLFEHISTKDWGICGLSHQACKHFAVHAASLEHDRLSIYLVFQDMLGNDIFWWEYSRAMRSSQDILIEMTRLDLLIQHCMYETDHIEDRSANLLIAVKAHIQHIDLVKKQAKYLDAPDCTCSPHPDDPPCHACVFHREMHEICNQGFGNAPMKRN